MVTIMVIRGSRFQATTVQALTPQHQRRFLRCRFPAGCAKCRRGQTDPRRLWVAIHRRVN
jgi:hypothetical protein